MFDTDVFVIGGGPAGIAAAMAARSRGLRVVLADGSRPPIDKACGEGLMPDSIAAAERIGIRLPESAGFRFRGIRFLGEGHAVASNFPHGYGVGFRRTALHKELVEQAGNAGVEMLWMTPVSGIGANAVQLNGRSISTRWIVGADGSGSRVRRWAGLDRFARNSRRFAYRRHFACKPWTDLMEIYWGEARQIYVTPVAANEVCVALIERVPEVRLDEALRHFPLLEARLHGMAASSHERGAVTATAQLKGVARGNVALIGDASGSVDAITGEGLCQAFQQSAALAEAIAAGDLSGYSKAHRRIAFRPAFMADMMLSMDRWPAIRRRALGAMAGRPQCFANLLAGHVGELRAAQLVRASLSLGWQMITV
jgi:flavin-dependent dehydrogenase